MVRQPTDFPAPRKRGAGQVLDYYGPVSFPFKIPASATHIMSFGPFLPGTVIRALRFVWTVNEDGVAEIRASRLGVRPQTDTDVDRGISILERGDSTTLGILVLSSFLGTLYDFEIPIQKRVGAGTEFIGVAFQSTVSITNGFVGLL